MKEKTATSGIYILQFNKISKSLYVEKKGHLGQKKGHLGQKKGPLDRKRVPWSEKRVPWIEKEILACPG